MTVTKDGRSIARGMLVHVVPGAVAVLVRVRRCGAERAAAATGRSRPVACNISRRSRPPMRPRHSRTTPGLFGAIGRWLDNSVGGVAAGWSSARDTVGNIGSQATDAAKGAAGVARDAAATVARIPARRAGVRPPALRAHRQRRTGLPARRPRCCAASKGYTSGTSLHIQSEQKCPVWGWISGEKTVGKCNTETYVTSAMCR